MKILRRAMLLSIAYCLLVTQAMATGYEFVQTGEYDYDKSADHSALIRKAIDGYRYRMTVEWDQNDRAFQAFAKSEFEKEMLELMSKGVSAQEIHDYMSSNMLDAKTRAEYTSLVETMKKQGKSEEEVAQATTKFMEKNYNVGASYSGGASSGWGTAAIIIGIVVVVVVTVIIIRSHDDDENPTDPNDPDLKDPCKIEWTHECCDVVPQEVFDNPCTVY